MVRPNVPHSIAGNQVIQVIYQECIDSGKFPTDLNNNANVGPVFRTGHKCEPANYMPISLTCELCKQLEHIVASNIIGYLDFHNILYDHLSLSPF